MVLRGEQIPLLNGIKPVVIDHLPAANCDHLPPANCDHRHAYIGLDAHYYAECKKSILAGTASYQKVLNNAAPKGVNNRDFQ